MTVEVIPNTITTRNGQLALDTGLAKPGDMFAVTAEWCGHCTNLKKNVEAAQRLGKFTFFNFTGDASPAHQQAAKQLGVRGFPTVFKVKPYGLLERYEGPRHPEAIASTFSRTTSW